MHFQKRNNFSLFRNDFTCICFGQTGSGKTHTLFGNKQQDGICILTAQSLFASNEIIMCGFYEIYNGQLYDLINKNNKYKYYSYINLREARKLWWVWSRSK